MSYLALALSFAVALLVVPRVLAEFVKNGHVRENYRGRSLPFPGGVALIVTFLLSLLPLALIFELQLVSNSRESIFRAGFAIWMIYLLGVALLGLIDDAFSSEARGWRGHLKAIKSGSFSTGALKAVGALTLALFTLSGWGNSFGKFAVAVLILVLSTNLFNLLDLRPGRAFKCFLFVAVLISLLSWSLVGVEVLSPLLGAVLVVGFFDLREQTMLGDTGSNLIGGMVGIWILISFDLTGQLIALGLLVLITLYAEFRSLTTLIDRIPLLRKLDSLGRAIDE